MRDGMGGGIFPHVSATVGEEEGMAVQRVGGRGYGGAVHYYSKLALLTASGAVGRGGVSTCAVLEDSW